ncbi:MAG: 2,4-diaminopentanoate dehydrogenase [Candidatus Izemoplasmataceae bacterium]
MKNMRVGVWGFGAMGQGIVEMIGEKPHLELVGVCDIHPDYQGRRLSDILGRHYSGEDVEISKNIDSVIELGPDLMIIATDSHVKSSFSKMERVLKKGINIISTAEEMAYPKANAPELAQKLDTLAKKHNVSCLGTGINPGFVMDLLAVFMTAPMQRLDRIEITRINNLSPFGHTVMEEQGVGLSIEEFEKKRQEGNLAGHVGFKESVYMIGEALGVSIENFEQTMKPIIAQKERQSKYGHAPEGHVAGINMEAIAHVDGKPFIIMKHPQQIEPQEEGIDTGDYVTLHGSPKIELSITPEIDGGIGTIAMCVNMIPKVVEASAGLKTMIDLGVPHAFDVSK